MKFNCLVFSFLILSIYSCVTDHSKSSEKKGGIDIVNQEEQVKKVVVHEPSEEDRLLAKKRFEEPGIIELTVDIDIPSKEDWYLSRELTLEGFTPVGIAYHIPDVYISDTIQQIVMRVSLEEDKKLVILNDAKAIYVNQRAGRVLLPIFSHDSIFVYRGSPELYKFQIPYELKNPTFFEGNKINNFTIVDQGNNRIVRNRNSEYSTFGSYGNGNGEFDSPTTMLWANGRMYVVDTGNKRVQVFNEDGKFEKIFGLKESLIRPTGIASDGKSIFLCDEGQKKILVYTPDGDLLYKMDKFTEAPSDLYFKDGKLYIADKAGATIKILSNKVYES